MAKSSVLASGNRATKIDPDNTGHRIRAYLASMQIDPDCEWTSEAETEFNRGRSLMERLAISCPAGPDDDRPTLKLTSAECADILTYMSCSMPIDGRDWWDDHPKSTGISHVSGYMAVLDAMADSLRPAEAEPAEASEAGANAAAASFRRTRMENTDILNDRLRNIRALADVLANAAGNGQDLLEGTLNDVACVIRDQADEAIEAQNSLDVPL